MSSFSQDFADTADLVSSATSYESELTTTTFTLTADEMAAGTNFVSFAADTNAVQGNDDLELRITQALQDSLSLENGCEVTIMNTPLSLFGATVQLSAYRGEDIEATCP